MICWLYSAHEAICLCADMRSRSDFWLFAGSELHREVVGAGLSFLGFDVDLRHEPNGDEASFACRWSVES